MEKFESIKKESILPEKFDLKEISKYHEIIEQSYIKKFLDKNFKIHENINLVAGNIDKSVVFIGSTISALKSLYINDKIPPEGVIIKQPCIRTHNLKNIYSEKENKGNTFFNLIGGIASENKFFDVYNLSLQYFLESLKIDRDRLFVRVSSKDQDILNKLKTEAMCPNIEIDGRSQDYYRWEYGINGVLGRGVAFGVKNTKEVEKTLTLGNIIIMESKNHPNVVQWGYGTESIISGIYNKDKVIEGSIISQIIPYEPGLKSKFSDALAATMEMYNSGLKPSNRGAESYLKSYLKGVAYLINRLNIKEDDLEKYIRGYCKLRNIENVSYVYDEIRKEIDRHNFNLEKMKQILKTKSVIELKQMVEHSKIIDEFSNKYRISPQEIIITINNFIK